MEKINISQIGSNYVIKKNQNFTKRLRKKLKIKKNKDWSWNLKTLEDNFKFLHGHCDFLREWEKKWRKKKPVNNEPHHHPIKKKTWQRFQQ